MKSIFFDLTIYTCLFGAFVYLLCAVMEGKKVIGRIGFGLLTLSVLSGVAYKIEEWSQSGRPPFVSNFEVLTTLAIALMAIYLIFEILYNISFVGPFVALLALATIGYATLFPESPRPLTPALRNSFWLTIHVAICFVSYSGFFLAFVVGLVHQIRVGGKHKNVALLIMGLTVSGLLITAALMYLHKRNMIEIEWSVGTWFAIIGAILFFAMTLFWPLGALFGKIEALRKVDPLKLENFVYRGVMFGFPLLGLGIIAGAVWADLSWGRYWGWDPKETWSLITWLLYFVSLHLRFVMGWRGARFAWFAVGGFFAILFTFFGANYILSGLHSYAFGD